MQPCQNIKFELLKLCIRNGGHCDKEFICINRKSEFMVANVKIDLSIFRKFSDFQDTFFYF